MIEVNIWLSTLDRNETLLLHDAKSTELAELDMHISKAQSMLGLQSRQEAKAPVPESGSSVNSFMRGIGSRLRLK